ncbi:hypothetical protein Micbo1qcDRAFT_209809 [Microdochium bolleyi]|uniref:Uncharacterized protein n=1 Tax=Microdochium bolleyi TaxID=196109 RepID=A0A136ILB9_9PEZI|nr:hypothetical protein Micbo1qcDRAFT_209809 [Microdochium bolleyi]
MPLNNHNQRLEKTMHTISYASNNSYFRDVQHGSRTESNTKIAIETSTQAQPGSPADHILVPLNTGDQLLSNDVATEDTMSPGAPEHCEDQAETEPLSVHTSIGLQTPGNAETSMLNTAQNPGQDPPQDPLQSPPQHLAQNPGHASGYISDTAQANARPPEPFQQATAQGEINSNHDESALQTYNQSQHHSQNTNHPQQFSVRQEEPGTSSAPAKKSSRTDNLLALGAGMVAGAAIGAAGYAAYKKLQGDGEGRVQDARDSDNDSVLSWVSSISSRSHSSEPNSVAGQGDQMELDYEQGTDAQTKSEGFYEDQFTSWDQYNEYQVFPEEVGSRSYGGPDDESWTSDLPSDAGSKRGISPAASLYDENEYWRNSDPQDPDVKEVMSGSAQHSPISLSDYSAHGLQSPGIVQPFDWETNSDQNGDHGDPHRSVPPGSGEDHDVSDWGQGDGSVDGSVHGYDREYPDYDPEYLHSQFGDELGSDADSAAGALSEVEPSENGSALSGDEDDLMSQRDFSHAYESDDNPGDEDGSYSPGYDSDAQSDGFAGYGSQRDEYGAGDNIDDDDDSGEGEQAYESGGDDGGDGNDESQGEAYGYDGAQDNPEGAEDSGEDEQIDGPDYEGNDYGDADYGDDDDGFYEE